MRKSTTPLTPAQVYRFAIEFCQPHLDLRGKGKVTTTVLLTVLFAAAARTLLDPRDLLPTRRRPLRRHLRQGPLRQPQGPRADRPQGQRRLPRPPAPRPAPQAEAAAPRHRQPHPHPLLWRTLPRRHRGLPRREEGRHPLVLRLRHRLSAAPRRTLYSGGRPGDPHRAAQGRPPGAAAPGGQGGDSSRVAVAGPRLLQGRDHQATCSRPAGRS